MTQDADAVAHHDEQEGGGHGSAGRDGWREYQESLGPWPITRTAEDVAAEWTIEDDRDELLNVLEEVRGLMDEGAFDAALRLIEQVLAEHSDGEVCDGR